MMRWSSLAYSIVAVHAWMWICGCTSIFVRAIENGSLPTRTTVVLLACLIIIRPDIIYHLTWEGSCVRKTLNQVDQKLINARFFGIGPGMFGLIQGLD